MFLLCVRHRVSNWPGRWMVSCSCTPVSGVGCWQISMAAGAQQAWGTAGVAAWLEEAAKGAHGPRPQPAFCHFSAISCPRRRRAGQLFKASCHAPLCPLLNTTEHLVLGQLPGSPRPHADPSWTYRAAGMTDFSLSRRPVLLKLDVCPGFPELSVKHPPEPCCWDLALAGGWASGSVIMATAKGICRDGHHRRNVRLWLGLVLLGIPKMKLQLSFTGLQGSEGWVSF